MQCPVPAGRQTADLGSTCATPHENHHCSSVKTTPRSWRYLMLALARGMNQCQWGRVTPSANSCGSSAEDLSRLGSHSIHMRAKVSISFSIFLLHQTCLPRYVRTGVRWIQLSRLRSRSCLQLRLELCSPTTIAHLSALPEDWGRRRSELHRPLSDPEACPLFESLWRRQGLTAPKQFAYRSRPRSIAA